MNEHEWQEGIVICPENDESSARETPTVGPPPPSCPFIAEHMVSIETAFDA